MEHQPSSARDLDGGPERIAVEQYVRLMTGVGERSGQLGDTHAQPPASE
jgi:hypothetical protein